MQKKHEREMVKEKDMLALTEQEDTKIRQERIKQVTKEITCC